jgi:CheY-like chemotaxis protein
MAKGRKILIIDDSEVVREVARFVLEAQGHEVTELSSAFGSSQTLNKLRPDLVLIDVEMPGLRGDKVVEVVLNHKLHRCPIVFYSDRPEAELRELVARTGATGYIRKSPGGDRLAEEVERYLAQ